MRDEFWNGGPALDVFAVEEYEKIDIAHAAVNETLGYVPDFAPQGLWRVGDDRRTASWGNSNLTGGSRPSSLRFSGWSPDSPLEPTVGHDG